MRADGDRARSIEGMKVEEKSMMGERLRCSGAVRVRSLACGMLCAALMGTPAVQAGEALRLLLVNDAEATAGECIRGTLFVVQGFTEADVSHGVRIADTLEIPAATQVLAEGVYSGSVSDEAPSGWRIELAPGGVALRAHPAGVIADGDAGVFLGRHAGAPAGACTIADDRLEDGEVVTKRLQRLSSWGASQQPIEVMVRP